MALKSAVETAMVAFAIVSLAPWTMSCAPREGKSSSPREPDLETPQPLLELDVAGHNPAIVSMPYDVNAPKPLLVAAHGAGDRAEWHCELWRTIVQGRAFVLCPQGRRTDRRVPHEQAAYYYPDHHALDEEIQAAIAALRQRHQNHLDATAAVYAGFSQGAIHGALIIVNRPKLFPRAALVEGGNGFFNEWSLWAARRFRDGGGNRVLFGCGSIWCVRTAERCAGYLDHAGAAARVVHAEGAGHSYGPRMQVELQASFEWLVRGDSRWTH